MIVQANARPTCDQILEMPSVRKIGERLFGAAFFFANEGLEQPDLLNTIRVPKNLLYLTDRLPKPSYHSYERQQRSTQIIRHQDHTLLLDDSKQTSLHELLDLPKPNDKKLLERNSS
jgi:NIMA (never in mitosis gene a)-related kinase